MSRRTGEPERVLAATQRPEAGLEALYVGITSCVAKHMRDRHGPNRRDAPNACAPSSAVDGAVVAGSLVFPFETADEPYSHALDLALRPPITGNCRVYRVDRRNA